MIPEAAVEAAALAMFVRTYERDEWEMVINQTKYRYLQDARAALEAAGAHILADAWDAGFDYARSDSWTEDANPHRPTP